MAEQLNKNMELMNKKMEENTEMISKKMGENNERINTKIDGEITVVRRELVEVHERCEPVSYTHLDVYKRQGEHHIDDRHGCEHLFN